jgi:hypothetical protein
MNQSQTVTSTANQTYPVSNLVYDVATLISERCKGLEALKQYMRDAQQGGHEAFLQLAQKMQQQDQENVRELEKILARNIQQ